MTRLELGRYREPEGQVLKGYALNLDGVELPDSLEYSVLNVGKPESRLELHTGDFEVINKIRQLKIDEISPPLENVYLYGITPLNYYISVDASIERELIDKPTFKISLNILSHKWKNIWSIEEFKEEIPKSAITAISVRVNSNSFEEYHNIEFEFELVTQSTTIQAEFDQHFPLVQSVFQKAEHALRSKLAENSLLTHFNFPEEIRTSCEQYLLYFVQFLKDVGVEASAKIEHESGESGAVLFSVTPADGKEALDKVRQALEVYLDLAQRPNTNPDFAAAIEIQKLQFQISNFQGQLHLARAELMAKESAIKYKDALIAQLEKGTVFQAAKEDDDDKRKVTLLGGMLVLKKYESELGDIDIPLLFDYMKRWFAEEESTGQTFVDFMKAKIVEISGGFPRALPPAE